MVNKIRKNIKSLLSEKPITDPSFEIQRLIRVAGFKIKEAQYDEEGNVHVKLAFSADIEDVMRYLNSLDKLPAKVIVKDNKLVIKAK